MAPRASRHTDTSRATSRAADDRRSGGSDLAAVERKLAQFKKLYNNFRNDENSAQLKALLAHKPEVASSMDEADVPKASESKPSARSRRRVSDTSLQLQSTGSPITPGAEQLAQRLVTELEVKDRTIAGLQSQLSKLESKMHVHQAREDEARAAFQRQIQQLEDKLAVATDQLHRLETERWEVLETVSKVAANSMQLERDKRDLDRARLALAEEQRQLAEQEARSLATLQTCAAAAGEHLDIEDLNHLASHLAEVDVAISRTDTAVRRRVLLLAGHNPDTLGASAGGDSGAPDGGGTVTESLRIAHDPCLTYLQDVQEGLAAAVSYVASYTRPDRQLGHLSPVTIVRQIQQQAAGLARALVLLASEAEADAARLALAEAQGREREAQLAALLSDNRRLVAQMGTLQQADQAMAQDLQKQRQENEELQGRLRLMRKKLKAAFEDMAAQNRDLRERLAGMEAECSEGRSLSAQVQQLKEELTETEEKLLVAQRRDEQLVSEVQKARELASTSAELVEQLQVHVEELRPRAERAEESLQKELMEARERAESAEQMTADLEAELKDARGAAAVAAKKHEAQILALREEVRLQLQQVVEAYNEELRSLQEQLVRMEMSAAAKEAAAAAKEVAAIQARAGRDLSSGSGKGSGGRPLVREIRDEMGSAAAGAAMAAETSRAEAWRQAYEEVQEVAASLRTQLKSSELENTRLQAQLQQATADAIALSLRSSAAGAATTTTTAYADPSTTSAFAASQVATTTVSTAVHSEVPSRQPAALRRTHSGSSTGMAGVPSEVMRFLRHTDSAALTDISDLLPAPAAETLLPPPPSPFSKAASAGSTVKIGRGGGSGGELSRQQKAQLRGLCSTGLETGSSDNDSRDRRSGPSLDSILSMGEEHAARKPAKGAAAAPRKSSGSHPTRCPPGSQPTRGSYGSHPLHGSSGSHAARGSVPRRVDAAALTNHAHTRQQAAQEEQANDRKLRLESEAERLANRLVIVLRHESTTRTVRSPSHSTGSGSPGSGRLGGTGEGGGRRSPASRRGRSRTRAREGFVSEGGPGSDTRKRGVRSCSSAGWGGASSGGAGRRGAVSSREGMSSKGTDYAPGFGSGERLRCVDAGTEAPSSDRAEDTGAGGWREAWCHQGGGDGGGGGGGGSGDGVGSGGGGGRSDTDGICSAVDTGPIDEHVASLQEQLAALTQQSAMITSQVMEIRQQQEQARQSRELLLSPRLSPRSNPIDDAPGSSLSSPSRAFRASFDPADPNSPWRHIKSENNAGDSAAKPLPLSSRSPSPSSPLHRSPPPSPPLTQRTDTHFPSPKPLSPAYASSAYPSEPFPSSSPHRPLSSPPCSPTLHRYVPLDTTGPSGSHVARPQPPIPPMSQMRQPQEEPPPAQALLIGSSRGEERFQPRTGGFAEEHRAERHQQFQQQHPQPQGFKGLTQPPLQRHERYPAASQDTSGQSSSLPLMESISLSDSSRRQRAASQVSVSELSLSRGVPPPTQSQPRPASAAGDPPLLRSIPSPRPYASRPPTKSQLLHQPLQHAAQRGDGMFRTEYSTAGRARQVGSSSGGGGGYWPDTQSQSQSQPYHGERYSSTDGQQLPYARRQPSAGGYQSPGGLAATRQSNPGSDTHRSYQYPQSHHPQQQQNQQADPVSEELAILRAQYAQLQAQFDLQTLQQEELRESLRAISGRRRISSEHSHLVAEDSTPTSTSWPASGLSPAPAATNPSTLTTPRSILATRNVQDLTSRKTLPAATRSPGTASAPPNRILTSSLQCLNAAATTPASPRTQLPARSSLDATRSWSPSAPISTMQSSFVDQQFQSTPSTQQPRRPPSPVAAQSPERPQSNRGRQESGGLGGGRVGSNDAGAGQQQYYHQYHHHHHHQQQQPQQEAHPWTGHRGSGSTTPGGGADRHQQQQQLEQQQAAAVQQRSPPSASNLRQQAMSPSPSARAGIPPSMHGSPPVVLEAHAQQQSSSSSSSPSPPSPPPPPQQQQQQQSPRLRSTQEQHDWDSEARPLGVSFSVVQPSLPDRGIDDTAAAVTSGSSLYDVHGSVSTSPSLSRGTSAKSRLSRLTVSCQQSDFPSLSATEGFIAATISSGATGSWGATEDLASTARLGATGSLFENWAPTRSSVATGHFTRTEHLNIATRSSVSTETSAPTRSSTATGSRTSGGNGGEDYRPGQQPHVGSAAGRPAVVPPLRLASSSDRIRSAAAAAAVFTTSGSITSSYAALHSPTTFATTSARAAINSNVLSKSAVEDTVAMWAASGASLGSSHGCDNTIITLAGGVVGQRLWGGAGGRDEEEGGAQEDDESTVEFRMGGRGVEEGEEVEEMEVEEEEGVFQTDEGEAHSGGELGIDEDEDDEDGVIDANVRSQTVSSFTSGTTVSVSPRGRTTAAVLHPPSGGIGIGGGGGAEGGASRGNHSAGAPMPPSLPPLRRTTSGSNSYRHHIRHSQGHAVAHQSHRSSSVSQLDAVPNAVQGSGEAVFLYHYGAGDTGYVDGQFGHDGNGDGNDPGLSWQGSNASLQPQDGPEVPPEVLARMAQYAGDEGLARPSTAVPSALRTDAGVRGAPVPPEVLSYARQYTSGGEGDVRPSSASPSVLRAGSTREVPVPPEVLSYMQQYTGNEGGGRPSSAAPSVLAARRSVSLERPVPDIVLHMAAQFQSGGEGVSRPTTAPSSDERRVPRQQPSLNTASATNPTLTTMTITTTTTAPAGRSPPAVTMTSSSSSATAPPAACAFQVAAAQVANSLGAATGPSGHSPGERQRHIPSAAAPTAWPSASSSSQRGPGSMSVFRGSLGRGGGGGGGESGAASFSSSSVVDGGIGTEGRGAVRGSRGSVLLSGTIEGNGVGEASSSGVWSSSSGGGGGERESWRNGQLLPESGTVFSTGGYLAEERRAEEDEEEGVGRGQEVFGEAGGFWSAVEESHGRRGGRGGPGFLGPGVARGGQLQGVEGGEELQQHFRLGEEAVGYDALEGSYGGAGMEWSDAVGAMGPGDDVGDGSGGDGGGGGGGNFGVVGDEGAVGADWEGVQWARAVGAEEQPYGDRYGGGQYYRNGEEEEQAGGLKAAAAVEDKEGLVEEILEEVNELGRGGERDASWLGTGSGRGAAFQGAHPVFGGPTGEPGNVEEDGGERKGKGEGELRWRGGSEHEGGNHRSQGSSSSSSAGGGGRHDSNCGSAATIRDGVGGATSDPGGMRILTPVPAWPGFGPAAAAPQGPHSRAHLPPPPPSTTMQGSTLSARRENRSTGRSSGSMSFTSPRDEHRRKDESYDRGRVSASRSWVDGVEGGPWGSEGAAVRTAQPEGSGLGGEYADGGGEYGVQASGSGSGEEYYGHEEEEGEEGGGGFRLVVGNWLQGPGAGSSVAGRRAG